MYDYFNQFNWFILYREKLFDFSIIYRKCLRLYRLRESEKIGDGIVDRRWDESHKIVNIRDRAKPAEPATTRTTRGGLNRIKLDFKSWLKFWQRQTDTHTLVSLIYSSTITLRIVTRTDIYCHQYS